MRPTDAIRRKRFLESRRRLREEFDEEIFNQLNRDILPKLHKLYRDTRSNKVRTALNELNDFVKDLMR